MSKKGLILTILILVVVISVSTITYAFYESSKAEFEFIAGSAMGDSIVLTLTNDSNTSLAPKETTAQKGLYSAKAGDSGSNAVYILEYTAGNDLNVGFVISNVSFTKDGSAINSNDELFLHHHLEFGLYRADNLDTYNINNLPTITTWEKEYDGSDEISLANVNPHTWFKYSGDDKILAGKGYVFCFIRFDPTITQELLRPEFDGVNIEITLTSQLLE